MDKPNVYLLPVLSLLLSISFSKPFSILSILFFMVEYILNTQYYLSVNFCEFNYN